MWNVARRALLPVLVLACGIALLTYGVRKHTAYVFEEQEIEIPIGPPMIPGVPQPGGFGGPPGMGGMPPGFPGGPGGMPPFGGAPMPQPKVKQKIHVGKHEPEMKLVRDVTIGGLVLLDTGDLRRTYSGAPPSLCPT